MYLNFKKKYNTVYILYKNKNIYKLYQFAACIVFHFLIYLFHLLVIVTNFHFLSLNFYLFFQNLIISYMSISIHLKFL